MDGTPPAYHLHPGSGAGNNSWIVNLEVSHPSINQLTPIVRFTNMEMDAVVIDRCPIILLIN